MHVLWSSAVGWGRRGPALGVTTTVCLVAVTIGCSQTATIEIENTTDDAVSGEVDGEGYNVAAGGSASKEVQLGRTFFKTTDKMVRVTGDGECAVPFSMDVNMVSNKTTRLGITAHAAHLVICNDTGGPFSVFASQCPTTQLGDSRATIEDGECVDLKLSAGCWTVSAIGAFGAAVDFGREFGPCERLEWTVQGPGPVAPRVTAQAAPPVEDARWRPLERHPNSEDATLPFVEIVAFHALDSE